MLSLDQIKNFYPKSENISERNMLREYLQYKILAIIFSTPASSKMTFIGGTAIRIVYNSDRFSEDLDFDTETMSKNEFRELIESVKRSLEKEGLQMEVRNVFKDTFRCYLKITGLLHEYSLSPHEDERLLIQIDARKQEVSLQPDFHIINKFGVFAEIRVNAPSIILAEKISALLTRKRIMGRDLYDTVYLSSLTKPDTKYLQDRLNYSAAEEIKQAIKEKLKPYKLQKLATDIAPFVANENKLEIVYKFNKWLEGWSY